MYKGNGMKIMVYNLKRCPKIKKKKKKEQREKKFKNMTPEGKTPDT